MSLRKTLLFLFLILAYCGMAATALRPSGRDVDSLIEYATGESKKGNFDEVAVVAGRLLELGRERDDRKVSLYGLIYTGHALAREVSDSVKYYYGRALDLAAGLEDYRALAAINNALAIYTSEMEMNYLEGLSYFMKALKYAEQSSDKHSYPVILNNIAMAHYLRNDPNGLKYSLEVIDIGTTIRCCSIPAPSSRPTCIICWGIMPLRSIISAGRWTSAESTSSTPKPTVSMPTYWSVSGVRVRRPPITNVRSNMSARRKATRWHTSITAVI
ncbi:hypothetical protein [Alistipes finegoldii]|uniref:hypothetical protein n=1 Tax=Alistipes finegoldii TaxID=214856 RepID=UPI00248BC4F8|nr:hypothetical protein [Alistipes finegoldii]